MAGGGGGGTILKMAFCGSNFSSDLVVKYVLMKLKIQHFSGEAFGARISNAIKILPPPHS
jgi:hypothetical protein